MTETTTKKLDGGAFTALYPELQAHIQGMESSYPLDYQRVDAKTRPVIEELGHFSGAKVADIGSNFGMFSLLTSPFAREVVGLERSAPIHAVSEASRSFFESKGYDLSNVRFVNKAVKAIVDTDYDALLMTLVLYHLNDQEVDMLMEDARKKCERAIIQCRPGRGVEFHRGALTDHISRNERYDGLYDIAGNIRFLNDIGLKKIRVSVSPQLFGREVFPVLVAER